MTSKFVIINQFCWGFANKTDYGENESVNDIEIEVIRSIFHNYFLTLTFLKTSTQSAFVTVFSDCYHCEWTMWMYYFYSMYNQSGPP